MSINNKLPLIQMKNINQKYLSKRKEAIKIIRATSAKLNFNSKTFFNSIYYMDIVASKDQSLQKLSDFILIGLGCLSLSSKFNENEPSVPDMKQFVNVLSNLTRFRYRFTLQDLIQCEIKCIKQLDYKLNLYSLYHFLVFFFTHGIFFASSQNDNTSYNKILEKIYITAREILDIIIEEELLLLGDDCIITAVVIFRKAIEVWIKNSKPSDAFKEIYCIDDKKERYNKIYKLISSVYDNKISKKSSSKSIKHVTTMNQNIDYKKLLSNIKSNFDTIMIFKRKMSLNTNAKEENVKNKKRAYSFEKNINKKMRIVPILNRPSYKENTFFQIKSNNVSNTIK